ncbi:RnfH family protein, partial [Vibrio cholerae]
MVSALPHEQRVLKLVVEQSATVEEIIRTSGILQMYPEIDLTVNKVGIFSRNVKLDARVRDKDRIE